MPLLSLLLLLLSWIGLHLVVIVFFFFFFFLQISSLLLFTLFKLFSSVLYVERDEKANHFKLILLTGRGGQSWPSLSLLRLCCSPYWSKNLDLQAIIKLLLLSLKQNMLLFFFFFGSVGPRLSFHFPLLRPVINQNLFFTGMKYTTATFARAMCNVVPAFTFSMAWILG